MNTETALITSALAVSAAGGAVADAVKKQIFHAHGIDWRLLATLAEALRIEAGTLARMAEQQIDAQGLSSVTFGQVDMFDDHLSRGVLPGVLLSARCLPGDVADGIDRCQMCEESDDDDPGQS